MSRYPSSNGRPTSRGSATSILLRLWLAAPDWVFRALGASAFLVYLAMRLPDYRDFWRVGVWYTFAGGQVIFIPWGRVLVDSTYLLIALGFLLRGPPKWRADRPREIVLPLVAAFWPFLPFMIEALLNAAGSESARSYERFIQDPRTWTPARFLAGATLIIVGNALDVWGYATLLRSLSIVAEARELKVTGPYRLVRHPIYLGQMTAQAGVWLFFANRHVIWIAFYLAFVVMQLYRAKIEDDVLERAFGERYLAWKRRTFWFF